MIFTGTGKTFTGVVLISIFCSINKEICAKGGKKRIVLFCGPSNKSVDLVTGIVKVFHFKEMTFSAIIPFFFLTNFVLGNDSVDFQRDFRSDKY